MARLLSLIVKWAHRERSRNAHTVIAGWGVKGSLKLLKSKARTCTRETYGGALDKG